MEVRTYLLGNPYASDAMIVQATGASLATITKVRSKMVQDGIIPKPLMDRTSAPVKGEPTTKLSTEDADALLTRIATEARGESGEPLTTEESLSILATLARGAKADGNNKLAIDATLAFHRLQDRTVATQLGPPPPLTDEDKISRMTSLCDVVGPVILAKATHRALSAEDLVAFSEELSRLTATQPRPTPGASVEATHSSHEGTPPYAPQT